MNTKGLKRTPTFWTWRSIINRTNNPNEPVYKYYGGRGIKVCERWLDYYSFVEDMGERPDGTTIERIDNDGNYTLENCRWATRTDQARNRRLFKNNVSGVKGVRLDKTHGKWEAKIGYNYKQIRLGVFDNYEDAVSARLKAEDRLWA